MEKIYTFQSPDKKEFDKKINEFLELGGELIEGGYQVIKIDGGVLYSQVISLKNCGVVLYHDNGNIDFINYEGEKDGLSVRFLDTGEKIYEGTYKNRKLNGNVFKWYENGQMGFKNTFKDGKCEGLSFIWYESGQAYSKSNNKNGKKDGLEIWWYKNGQKNLELHFKDNELEGKQTGWYRNGELMEISYYLEGVKISGTSFYKNGQRKEETQLRDGEEIISKQWNEDGSMEWNEDGSVKE